jgi:hypothetical protein
MVSVKEYESALVERYVASFAKLDEMRVFPDLDPIAWQLSSGEPDMYGTKAWRPKETFTDRSALEKVHSSVPARLPKLYEHLVLSYRWAEVDLRTYRLIANPPGDDLSGLLQGMTADRHLWASLGPAGFIQFAKGPDCDYDPVCFDTKARKKNGDCKIVKIDHEEILCNYRIKVVAELAPSFEELMVQTIEMARERSS